MRTGLAAEKRKLEDYVLGAILIDGSAYEAIRFLKPTNFGKYEYVNNSLIFQAITELTPTSVIDMATVSNHLLIKYNYKATYTLSVLTSYISSSAHISHHALLLLQLDLTEKFEILILKTAQNNTLKESQQMALLEVLKDTLINEDIFLAINATWRMMEKQDFPIWAIESVKKFDCDIDARIKQIKFENKVAAIFRHLESLNTNMNEEAKQAMKGLAAITKTIFETGVVEPQWKDVLINSQN
jgi:hypothetical protein